MHQKIRIALSILLLSLLLTACSKATTQPLVVEKEVMYYPSERFLTCEEFPAQPKKLTGYSVGEFLIKLKYAYWSCREAVIGIAKEVKDGKNGSKLD